MDLVIASYLKLTQRKGNKSTPESDGALFVVASLELAVWICTGNSHAKVYGERGGVMAMQSAWSSLNNRTTNLESFQVSSRPLGLVFGPLHCRWIGLIISWAYASNIVSIIAPLVRNNLVPEVKRKFWKLFVLPSNSLVDILNMT
nr:hypothetical protein [Tanacetum cinerariifolium]